MQNVKKVEVYLFYGAPDTPVRFLLLKRSPKLGSYWQPITGMVESGESLLDAALREAQEEAGISQVVRIIGPVYEFTFDENGVKFDEHVFGIEVQTTKVKLSSEHTEYRWTTFKEALALLYWENNRQALRQLARQILPQNSLDVNIRKNQPSVKRNL